MASVGASSVNMDKRWFSNRDIRELLQITELTLTEMKDAMREHLAHEDLLYPRKVDTEQLVLVAEWGILKYNHLLGNIRTAPDDSSFPSDPQLDRKVFQSIIHILRHNAASEGRYPSSWKARANFTLLSYSVRVSCVRPKRTARMTVADFSTENADPENGFQSAELGRLRGEIRRQIPDIPPNMEVWAGEDKNAVARTDIDLQNMLKDCWLEEQDPIQLYAR